MPRETVRPFVIVSDAPGQRTGLGRIATDLAARIWEHVPEVDLLHVGAVKAGPLPPQGIALDLDVSWPTWGFNESPQTPWRDVLLSAMRWAYPHGWTAPPIIFVVQDPARMYEWLAATPSTPSDPFRWWGYCSVDATTKAGTIGGPAAAAVQWADRVLAYGPYGARALSKLTETPVPWIPHGIDRRIFSPRGEAVPGTDGHRLLAPLDGQAVLGGVATNQPRKDLGLFFGVLAELRQRGHNLRGWLHVDREIGEAWSVPQLAKEFGVDSWQALTVTTEMTDQELAACYSGCAVTLAVGRGEGFGYPIAESLACGTPCVHADHGGGADLLPMEYLVTPSWLHAEGPYVVERPILSVEWTAKTVEAILTKKIPHFANMPNGDLWHTGLDWEIVWPQFAQWIQEGLDHDGR